MKYVDVKILDGIGLGDAYEAIECESHEEWIDFRRQGIGGSDVAPIMGISPYRTALDVWMDKTGRAGECEQTEAMYWGTQLEDLIARRFAQEHPDWVVEQVPATLVPLEGGRSYLHANLDRVVITDNGPAVLEIKTASAYKADYWKHGVPDYYLTQVCHYLLVTGWKVAYVAVLIGGNRYKEYRITRDEDDVQAVDRACEAFWKAYVKLDTMPQVVGADMRTLTDMYPGPSGDVVSGLVYQELESVSKADEAISDYQAASKQVRDAERARLDAKAKLARLIGDADGIMTDVAQVTWHRDKMERLDIKRLERERPDIYSRYLKTTTTSKITIKEI